MKKVLPLLMLGFGVALAVIIGQRMSTDAMAVVIGVAVGVAASVPTSLLLVTLCGAPQLPRRAAPAGLLASSRLHRARRLNSWHSATCWPAGHAAADAQPGRGNAPAAWSGRG